MWRSLAVTIAAWLFATTALAQQRTPLPWLAGVSAYETRTQACWKRYDDKWLKTFGEVVRCADDDVVASLEAVHYPAMDVVRWMVLEHRAIAERADKGKVTSVEGRAQWAALDVTISTELKQRARAREVTVPPPSIKPPPADPQQRVWWERSRCTALIDAHQITTIVGLVRCQDTAMRNYLEEIHFPFMDLELANEADHLAYAEDMDAERLTAEQGLALDNASDQRMITELNRRVEHARDAAQREVLLSVVEAFGRALSPSPGAITTDCRTFLPGQWQCQSH